VDAFSQSQIAKFLYGLAHFPVEVIFPETVDAMARRVGTMLPEFANQVHFHWGLQVRPLAGLELLGEPECWLPAVEVMAWLLALFAPRCWPFLPAKSALSIYIYIYIYLSIYLSIYL